MAELTWIQRRLLKLGSQKYRDFQSTLMPTVDKTTIIGISMPELRQFAKELQWEGEAEAFLSQLPHPYYEENNLHAILISGIREYDAAVAALDTFLPYVDNWATCDIICPCAFKKHPDALLESIRRWMGSTHTYTIRFGVEMLMKFYLDEAFMPEYLQWVASISSPEYYVNMMIAWYFATALAKQYDSAISYLEQRLLPVWVHNKTIQKAIESYRITQEQKTYLRTLRRKDAVR